MNFPDAAHTRRQTSALPPLPPFAAGPGTVRFEADAPAVAATFLAAGRDLDRVLDLAPALGRGFETDEYRAGAATVVLLTNRFWRSRFGADPAVIGRTIDIGSGRASIVGVLPAAADRFPVGGSDLWTPLAFPADSFLNQRGSIALAAVGRLRDGVTVDTAKAELATIAARLALAHPETNRERLFTIDSLQNAMVGPVRPMMLILAGAIAVLLAVACANIANLLLAQAQARGTEFALRAAIGASGWRLARQLWTETLALFAVAGAGGILVSRPIARVLVARYPEALPLSTDVTLDARVVSIACGVTLLTALATGLPQARRAGRWAIGAVLSNGTRATGDRRDRRTTAFFVAGAGALSTVVGSGGLV